MEMFTLLYYKSFFYPSHWKNPSGIYFSALYDGPVFTSSSCGLTRHTYWKDDPSPRHCTETRIMNASGHVWAGLLAGPLLCPLPCWSALAPWLRCCLTYRSLIMGLHSLLFFKIAVATPDPVPLHINFTISSLASLTSAYSSYPTPSPSEDSLRFILGWNKAAEG